MKQHYPCVDFLEGLRTYKENISDKISDLEYCNKIAGLNISKTTIDDVKARVKKIERDLDDEVKTKMLAENLIDRIEDSVARYILRQRYIFCDTWAKIAAACGGMSERNAHYIHDSVIPIFNEIYLEELERRKGK